MLKGFLFLVFVCISFQLDPKPFEWETGIMYKFGALYPDKKNSIFGYFIFNFDESSKVSGWKLKIQDSSVPDSNLPDPLPLRTKVFLEKQKKGLEVWTYVSSPTVGCEYMMEKPFEKSPCKSGKFTGLKKIILYDQEKFFANEFKYCNFDGYLINFFPHEGIGNNYTVYTSVFNPNRVLKVCVGEDCTGKVVDFFEAKMLTEYDLENELTDPGFCVEPTL